MVNQEEQYLEMSQLMELRLRCNDEERMIRLFKISLDYVVLEHLVGTWNQD